MGPKSSNLPLICTSKCVESESVARPRQELQYCPKSNSKSQKLSQLYRVKFMLDDWVSGTSFICAKVGRFVYLFPCYFHQSVFRYYIGEINVSNVYLFLFFTLYTRYEYFYNTWFFKLLKFCDFKLVLIYTFLALMTVRKLGSCIIIIILCFALYICEFCVLYQSIMCSK